MLLWVHVTQMFWFSSFFLPIVADMLGVVGLGTTLKVFHLYIQTGLLLLVMLSLASQAPHHDPFSATAAVLQHVDI
jgi:hypothetical protein